MGGGGGDKLVPVSPQGDMIALRVEQHSTNNRRVKWLAVCTHQVVHKHFLYHTQNGMSAHLCG